MDHSQPGLGTKKTGFVRAKFGPFLCGNCIHFKNLGQGSGICLHEDVRSDPEVPKVNGEVPVVVADCCDEFRSER